MTNHVSPPGHNRSRVAWFAVLGAIVVVTAALAVTRSRSEPDAGPAPTATNSGEAGRDFSVATTAGTFTFPTGKPTALLFIASDCPSCIGPAIALNRIERQLGDRIAAVGIDINPTDTDAEVQRFIEKAENPRYGFLVDADGRLTVDFDIRAQATVVFADAEGRIVERLEENSDQDAFLAALAKAGLQ